MEAPEKLYVDAEDRLGDSILYGFTEKRKEDDIEYVRKDAFIEKACEWLKEHKEHPFIGCEDPCLSGYLTDEFIEQFKKAMEE